MTLINTATLTSNCKATAITINTILAAILLTVMTAITATTAMTTATIIKATHVWPWTSIAAMAIDPRLFFV
uniref:Uncharacterized protein n=1 Tax=Romanomermis culicivorax TaxID=13658 RepID=A0A915KPD3_ROMCU